MRKGVLIQEEYSEDFGTVLGAWQIVVSTVMCQQTSGTQVRPVLDALFERWPSPSALHHAGDELESVLRPCGMQNRRASVLRGLSQKFAHWIDYHEDEFALPDAGWVATLPGCGDYTVEAYKFVALGDRSFRPVDKELRKAWNRDRGLVQPGVGNGM